MQDPLVVMVTCMTRFRLVVKVVKTELCLFWRSVIKNSSISSCTEILPYKMPPFHPVSTSLWSFASLCHFPALLHVVQMMQDDVTCPSTWLDDYSSFCPSLLSLRVKMKRPFVFLSLFVSNERRCRTFESQRETSEQLNIFLFCWPPV